MFDVGGGELLMIVLAILVLFGPKKIPEVASMVGKGMRKVRQAQDDFTQHMRDLSTDLEKVSDVKTAVQQLPEAEVVVAPETHQTMSEAQAQAESVTKPPTIQPAENNVSR